MKKKILVLGIVAVAVMAPVFATTNTGTAGTYTLNVGFIQSAVNLIVGIFAGGYCLLKAALDIFHAVRNSSEDQNGLKKAIGGFVLNAAILGGFMFVINYVFAKATGTDAQATVQGTASTDFFGGLSGALVSL